ncbi:unnamed protein product [Larinioides sclopetarius]|uniref:Uncharacterized protein n=1 Tax=Larinioides sclopetarius TaxID=280406 RepID=A0AAV2AZB8_9ARAC
MMRLIKGARNVIKGNSVKNYNEPQKKAVLNLIENLRNVPNHVFGEHNKCKETCERKNLEPDKIVYPLMRSSGLLHAIESEIGRILVACSNTLIWNATNNPAENYMSQVCKLSGGKRIDFSKSSGFKHRSTIAVLEFQSPAQQCCGRFRLHSSLDELKTFHTSIHQGLYALGQEETSVTSKNIDRTKLYE